MPVPGDPWPDFVPGTLADADKVDARFLELYKALDPARVGLDAGNMSATLLQSLHEPGDVKMSARGAPTGGWLLCDGSAVSRTTYAALFAAIGTAFGVGDGSTTFNLPNLAGRSPVGVGTATGAAGATVKALAAKGGEETHALTIAETPALTTDVSRPFFGSVVQGAGIDLRTGGSTGHNTLPPYQVVNFFIKT